MISASKASFPSFLIRLRLEANEDTLVQAPNQIETDKIGIGRDIHRIYKINRMDGRDGIKEDDIKRSLIIALSS